jgi:predicted  nucleic acid-binding Zn-ribbon protein
MLSNKDLTAISGIIKEQFREQFKEQFKEGIKGVESRLDRVENRLDSLETDVKDVKDRVDRIETDVKIIKIDSLENRVIPRLNTIEGYYVDASKRYIASVDRFEAAISDIDVMKQTIKNHSIAIQELQMKQA